jgi:F-type H+-transporting ATPase subunit a
MEADLMKKMRTWIILLIILAVFAGLYFLLDAIWGLDLGEYIQASLHIPRPKPEVIFHIAGLGITNTAFTSFVAMLLLVVLAGLVSREMRRRSDEDRIKNPSGFQNLAEWALEYVINLLEGAAGKGRLKDRPVGRVVFPLVGTLFIFILFANWISLVPGFSTILVVPQEAHVEAPAEHTEAVEHEEQAAMEEHAEEEHHGPPIAIWFFGKEKAEHAAEFAPLLRAANSHLAITAGMAIVAIIVVQAMGVVAHGPIGYLKHLATDAPMWMRFIMFPIHVLSEISRIISLSARLFGNLYGGDVLLAVIFNLIGPFLPAVFFGIEAFFYYIQALLFSVLTTVYIALLVGEGDHH